MLDLRIRSYAPNGASRGLIPAPQDYSAAVPLNDVPSLTLAYATAGPRAELLGSAQELAMEVSGDGGATWTEPDDCRFLLLRDGRDPTDQADTWQIEAPGYVWRLQKARVLAEGQATDGKRTLTGTPGFIFAKLWTEAQNRGALAGMTLSGNATTDAGGAAWGSGSTVTRSYDLGTDYLTILRDLADSGLLDFRTLARGLYLWKPDTALATDRTVGGGQVHLTPRQLTETPWRRTWEGLADTLLVGGDDNQSVTLVNPTAVKPWGRWEDFLAQGGVSDAGTLTALGQRYQTTTADARTEYTQGIQLQSDGDPRPLIDFKAGDFVWSRVRNTPPARYRVRQITVQRSGQTVQGNVVLNDRFLENDIRVQRTLNSLTGGASSASAGGAPTPTAPGADILQPADVATSPVLSSLAYLDDRNVVRSQVTVDWPDVSTNRDGTPINDLRGYIVQQKPGAPNGGGQWREVTRVDGDVSIVTLSPYTPGETWSFRVRAVDTSGNESNLWSAANSIVMATDTTGPTQPSTPVLKTRMGIVEYAWDGLSANATAMDDDFFYVEVHASNTAGFTPVKGNKATLLDRLSGPGYGVMPTPDYGVTWYFRFLAVDKAGNASVASAQSSKLAQLITTTDIQPGSITTPLLQAGSVTTDRLSVGARPVSVLVNGNMEDGWVSPDGTAIARPAAWAAAYENSGTAGYGWASGANAIAGDRSLLLNIPAGSDATVLNAQGSWYPVSPGEVWHVRMKFRADFDAPQGGRIIGLRFHTSTPGTNPGALFDPNATWTIVDSVTEYAGATVYTLQGNVVVPAGHTKMGVGFYYNSRDAAWTLRVDSVEAYPATTNDQVTTIGANKLTTGTIQANQRIISGNPIGGRVEQNAAGIEGYAANGITRTFLVRASDGYVETIGAFSTLAGSGLSRVTISAMANPWQDGQTWNTIQFYPDNPAWTPALIWAAYQAGSPNWGELDLFSPKLGGRQPARLRLRSEEQTNETYALMEANRLEMSGNLFTFGDPTGSSLLFRMKYQGSTMQQRWAFQSPGGRTVVFDWNQSGRTRIGVTNEVGARERVDLEGSDIFFNPSSAADLLQVSGASQQSNRIAVGAADANVALVYVPDALRVMRLNGSAYLPIGASAFSVNSDAREKTDEQVVSGVLAKVLDVPAYDYRTPHGQPRKIGGRRPPKGYAQRGLMAQDVQRYWPDAVSEDPATGMLAVDLYPMLTTLWAAVQDLAAEVDRLSA